MPGSPGPGPAPGTGRSRWHRRTGALPLAYLAAVVVVGVAHPFLPQWRWLVIHLLLLGAATNAILVWSNHFAAAVLRSPAPEHRRGEIARLVILNAGVAGVLAAGTVADGARWLAVAAPAMVFGAVLAHLVTLAVRLRRALPSRYRVSVHWYLAAATCLLAGVPVGGAMMLSHGDPRLLLFHAHVNVLGWITLTVLGTLLTLWPTVLRTRMAGGEVRASTRALPLAVAGLSLLGGGLLAWWPVVVAAGLGLLAGAVAVVSGPALAAARRRPPSSFAAWSIAAGLGWLAVALVVDLVSLLTAGGPAQAAGRFGMVLVPLLVGFVGQVLIGALSHLLPMALGGGPARVRARFARLDRHWSQRVVMGNLALAVFLLPVGPYLRITTSLLVMAALVQFLVPAVRVLISRR